MRNDILPDFFVVLSTATNGCNRKKLVKKSCTQQSRPDAEKSPFGQRRLRAQARKPELKVRLGQKSYSIWEMSEIELNPPSREGHGPIGSCSASRLSLCLVQEG